MLYCMLKGYVFKIGNSAAKNNIEDYKYEKITY